MFVVSREKTWTHHHTICVVERLIANHYSWQLKRKITTDKCWLLATVWERRNLICLLAGWLVLSFFWRRLTKIPKHFLSSSALNIRQVPRDSIPSPLWIFAKPDATYNRVEKKIFFQSVNMFKLEMKRLAK